MKRLSTIIELINDAIEEKFKECPSWDSLFTSAPYRGKYDIDIFLRDNKKTLISIINSEEPERNYFNIESYLEEQVLSLSDLEYEEYDEWNEHGFASEADYINWRFG